MECLGRQILLHYKMILTCPKIQNYPTMPKSTARAGPLFFSRGSPAEAGQYLHQEIIEEMYLQERDWAWVR